MKEIFKKLIIDFQERDFPNILARKFKIPLDSRKIVSLVGVRRSGKTFVLFDLINQLRQQVDPRNILYINFEDDRLFPLKLASLDLLTESYYELYPRKREETVYLFLDEVQVVAGWEQYVRRIYDSLNIRIYITGSSSRLLSKEIATSLRGRTITYEIFPFSFGEYLRFRRIDINLNSSSSLSFIKNALDSYLVDGGFAETIGEDPVISRKILSNYLELIVYKDIVDRYGVKNRSLLKHLNKQCFTNLATLISFNKLYNDFKSQGFKLSKNTIFEYISHLEDAYALFCVPIFRNSIREEQRNPKKVYAIDCGFKKIFDYAASQDIGKLYENTVFLDLRRQTSEIYYFKQKQEVDFYTKIAGMTLLINVSVDISDEKTRQRELGGLMEAMNYFNHDESWLITRDHDETVKEAGKTIYIRPLYKWLLRLPGS